MIANEMGLFCMKTLRCAPEISLVHSTSITNTYFGYTEAGVEIALIRLSGLSKKLSGQVDRPAEVIRRTSR